MKAILIDPFAREVTEIEYDGNWQQIKQIIGCQYFTTAGLSDGDTVFVDDEGLCNGKTAFFKHTHYPQPLAGKGLILGTDSEGESISPKLSFSEHKAHVAFVHPLRVNGEMVWLLAD